MLDLALSDDTYLATKNVIFYFFISSLLEEQETHKNEEVKNKVDGLTGILQVTRNAIDFCQTKLRLGYCVLASL